MSKIGAVLLFLGMAAADSEMLWIPFAMVMVGALMVWKGEKHGEKDC